MSIEPGKRSYIEEDENAEEDPGNVADSFLDLIRSASQITFIVAESEKASDI